MIMTRKILTALVWFGVALLSFTGVAVAAALADPTGDGSGFVDMVRPLYQAVLSGRYAYAACLALVAAAAGARTWGRTRYPWLDTEEGMAWTILLGSFGGALATALGAARWPTLEMTWQAGSIAMTAGGGAWLLRHAVVPRLRLWMPKLAPLLDLISTGIGTSPVLLAKLPKCTGTPEERRICESSEG